MHHPIDRKVTPVVEHWLEREIAQWVQPMKDRSDDPLHHEQMLLPQSYISLPKRKERGRKENVLFNDTLNTFNLYMLLARFSGKRRKEGNK